MKSVVSLSGRVAAVLVALAVLLLAPGCSKHDDDCPAPENNDQQATTRAFEADHGADVDEMDRPAGVNLRNAEGDTEGPGGEGISDDGDDEADGEGNKKVKPAH